MTRAKISCYRKLSILKVSLALVGKVFDLDENFVKPLGLAHDIVSENLGKLKRGGHLLYHHWTDAEGRQVYFMDSVSTSVMDEPVQPSLFGGLL